MDGNLCDLIKKALKEQNKTELRAYRNLKTEIEKILNAKNAPEYSENLFIKTCSKYCKSLEEAEKQYLQANREDLAIECREELEVLKKLLPAPVEALEIHSYIQSTSDYMGWIKEGKTQILKKEMGPVIKFLKEHFPTADGKIISEVVKQYVV